MTNPHQDFAQKAADIAKRLGKEMRDEKKEVNLQEKAARIMSQAIFDCICMVFTELAQEKTDG